MRLILLTSAIAFYSTSILHAQEGPPAPPPGPPTDLPQDNRGMGALNITPGEYGDPRTAAESALARSGDVRTGWDRSTEASQAQAYLAAIDKYVAGTDKRRIAAMSDAAGTPAQDAAGIRSALEKDLAGWRDAFGFDKATFQDQRGEWLTAHDGMTAGDWARRRADWFKARDAWIADQRAWATAKAAPPSP